VVSGAQDLKASNDAVATGVGVVLFWPALFFIKGDAGTAQEVAQLKGDMEAIEEANIQKKCGIQFNKAPGRRTPDPHRNEPLPAYHACPEGDEFVRSRGIVAGKVLIRVRKIR
jgi:hypothetical protein